MKKKIGLSIIIPVFNSEGWIGRTLEGVKESLKHSSFNAEIIVVDDGSTDKSVTEIHSFQKKYKGSFTLIEQENKGRYLARKAGISKAAHESILFIDSRIDVGKDSLKYLSKELTSTSDQIWNGHVHVAKEGNIFARFWDAIVFVAWRRYFRKPKKTSYGIDDFDYYPKGTGFFFVPKSRLIEATDFFEKNSSDLKYSSDDTLLIRYLAERQPIHLAPEFSCVYHGRSTLKGFLKHAYNRGQFFVDGFLRKGTRFFYPLLAVLLISVVALIGLIFYFTPVIYLVISALFVFALVLLLGALSMGVNAKDAGSLALLGVPFALVYLSGIWRGVVRRRPDRAFLKTITTKRIFLRGSIAEYIAVTLFYFTALLILTKGVLLNISTQIFASPGDATAGFMWLTYAEPGINPILEHTDDANYPVGESIGGPTFVTYSLIWLPIRIATFLTDPVAGVNIVMALGFISAALAMYWLVKRLTGNWFIALFAGYAAAFVPYAMYKSSGHIAYIFSLPFTAMLAGFIAIWRKPSVKRGLLLAVAIAVAFYMDGYYLLLASVMVLGLVLSGIVYNILSRRGFGQFWHQIKSLIVAAVGVVILAVPIVFTQLTQGQDVKQHLSSARSEIGQEIRAYSSNLADFLLPAPNHPVYKEVPGLIEATELKNQSAGTESLVYIGYGILVLVIIGAIFALIFIFVQKRKWFIVDADNRKKLILLACIVGVLIPTFLAFMMSPTINIFGKTIPLIGQLFIDYDIDFWRVMSRFFVPLHIVLVAFAAFVLYILYELLRGRSDRWRVIRTVVAYFVIALFFVFTAFEYYTNPDGRPYDFNKQTPEGYVWLEKQKDLKVVAELPMVDPLDSSTAAYLTAQLTHNKKLVNMRDPNDARLNNALGDETNPELIDFLRERNVDTVILRDEVCKTKYEWGILIHQSDYYGRSQLCIYNLLRAPSDNAFIVFGDGFIPDNDAMKMGQYRALSLKENNELSITTARLNENLVAGTKVNFQAYLQNTAGQTIKWSIVQDEKIISNGTSALETTVPIVAVLDASRPFRLVLSLENPMDSVRAGVKNVIVTRVK